MARYILPVFDLAQVPRKGMESSQCERILISFTLPQQFAKLDVLDQC